MRFSKRLVPIFLFAAVAGTSIPGCSKSRAAADLPLHDPADVSSSDSMPPESSNDKVVSLSLVSSVWSPFTDVEGKPRIATSLVQEALRRIGQAVTFATAPFPEVTVSIQAGTYAGSEALWKNTEREEYLSYSQPYLENRLVLLGRKGADVSAKSVNELSNKSLGLVEDYAYGSEVDEASSVKKLFFPTDEEALRALLQVKVDYILVDELLAYHLFEHESGKAKELLVAGKESLVLRGLHLALRRDIPNVEDLLRRFDEAILAMVRAGDYHRILNVNWIAVDADGDGQIELLPTGDRAGTQLPEQGYHLFGARAHGSPRFMIGDEVYEDWSNVPERYKVPQESGQSFVPGIGAVLFEF